MQEKSDLGKSESLLGRWWKGIPFMWMISLLLLLSIVIAVLIAVALTIVGNNKLMRNQAEAEWERVTKGLAGIIDERTRSGQFLAKQLSLQLSTGLVKPPTGNGLKADWEFILALSAVMAANNRRFECVYYRKYPEKSVFYMEQDPQAEVQSITMGYTFNNRTVAGWLWDMDQQNIGEMQWSQQMDIEVPDEVVDFWYPNAENMTQPGFQSYATMCDKIDSLVTSRTSTYILETHSDGVTNYTVGTMGLAQCRGTIGRMMREVPLSGYAFLIDTKTEQLLGTSGPLHYNIGDYLTTPEITGVPENSTYTDFLGKRTLEAVRAKLGGFKTAEAQMSGGFWLDNSAVVSWIPITNNGIEWLVVSVLEPEFASVDGVALGSAAGATAFFLILGVLLSWAMTVPLARMSKDMRSVAELKFDNLRSNNSVALVREVSQMQKSFTLLTAASKALAQIVPPEAALELMKGGAVMAAEGESTPSSDPYSGTPAGTASPYASIMPLASADGSGSGMMPGGVMPPPSMNLTSPGIPMDAIYSNASSAMGPIPVVSLNMSVEGPQQTVQQWQPPSKPTEVVSISHRQSIASRLSHHRPPS